MQKSNFEFLNRVKNKKSLNRHDKLKWYQFQLDLQQAITNMKYA